MSDSTNDSNDSNDSKGQNDEGHSDSEHARLHGWLHDRHERQFKQDLLTGTRLLAEGKTDEALPLLENAHKLKPDNADAALNLGGAYIMAGRHKLAVPVLERAVEYLPANAQLWINLGAAYLGNPITATGERQQRALEAFGHALEIDPLARSVAYNMGLIHRDRGEIDLAIAAFRRAVLADPNDRDAQRLLERTEQGSGDTGK